MIPLGSQLELKKVVSLFMYNFSVYLITLIKQDGTQFYCNSRKSTICTFAISKGI